MGISKERKEEVIVLKKTGSKKAGASAPAKQAAKPVSMRLTHVGVGFPGQPGKSHMMIGEVASLRNHLKNRGYRGPVDCDEGHIFLHRELLPIELADKGPCGSKPLWQLKDSEHANGPQEIHLPTKDSKAVIQFFELFGISLTQKGTAFRFVDGPETTDFHIGLHVPTAKDFTQMKLFLFETQVPALQLLAQELAKNKKSSDSGKTHGCLAGCGIEVTYGVNGLRGHNIVQQTMTSSRIEESPYPTDARRLPLKTPW